MKLLIRYIGLLLISGLMLPFCSNPTLITGEIVKEITDITKLKSVKCNAAGKLDEKGFSFFKDVVANTLPALKNLD